MSPRCTKTLHQISNCQHLGAVIGVGLETGNLGSKGRLVMKSRRSLHKSGTDSFGTRHTGGLKLTESTKGLVVEAN